MAKLLPKPPTGQMRYKENIVLAEYLIIKFTKGGGEREAG